LFICHLTEFRKNYSTDFHTLCYKGSTWATD